MTVTRALHQCDHASMRTNTYTHLIAMTLPSRPLRDLLEAIRSMREAWPIAGTAHHAVAVVDGVVRDVFDSREICDRTQYLPDGRLTELWIKGQTRKPRQPRETSSISTPKLHRKYTDAHHYDDLLTYGRISKITTSDTTWRQKLNDGRYHPTTQHHSDSSD